MPAWRLGHTEPLQALDEVRQCLLGARSVQREHEQEFFEPTYAGSIDNPFTFTGMSEAVERIAFGIERGERILVWGDYDADGVSATATLLDVLGSLGAQVAPYLPHRSDEGYGLHLGTLQRLKDAFDLLITVDCGGSSNVEIEWVVESGRDVIVVDHHELPQKLPPAMAILHPRHPDGAYSTSHLSGAGVAWKLAQALLRRFDADTDAEKWMLDLPLLGTLADSMPLKQENRAIVHFGLQVLARTRRAGLAALCETARITRNQASAEDVIFRIIPPINAAGRMDHPQAALDVLVAKTPKQAQKAAMRLMQLNQQRRQLTTRVMKQAQEVYDPALPLVFAYNADWPAGIVGIVAGRLAQQFQKPAVVIGGARDEAVGSARTFGDIDVYAALQQAAGHTLRLGGHKQAAGFSLEPGSISSFRDVLAQALTSAKRTADTETFIAVDGIIDEQLLTWQLYDLLQKFEPYGEGNRQPVFAVQGIAATQIRAVGKSDQHVKVTLVGVTVEIEAIGFNMSQAGIAEGASVDVIGSIELNRFNGSTSLQFHLLDMVPAGSATLI